MNVERAAPGTPQWAELAAPHLARYLFVAERVAGRRVLDLGSGAGYGAAVLRSAGADNRYVQQLWRISHRNLAVRPLVTFPEATVSIVEGFRRRGYATLGVAAMDWFAKPSPLQEGFEWFRVTGMAAHEQVQLVCEQVERRGRRRPCFAFINFGETHSPFRHAEMPPTAADSAADRMSLGRLFNAAGVPDAAGALDRGLWERQRECAEYLDRQMADLLDCFIARGRPTTVVVTADHGECLGEQGLCGHAFHHEKVMEVPLLIFRLNAPPHDPPRAARAGGIIEPAAE